MSIHAPEPAIRDAEAAVFQLDAATMREQLDGQGWSHASDALTPTFFADLQQQTDSFLGASTTSELADWHFPGKKAQFLWEPASDEVMDALLDEVSAFTGMDRDRITLAERHVKIYSPESQDFPPPHKDRSASTFTVGLAVRVPSASRLMLWPDADLRFNPYPTSADWRDSRSEAELPERAIEGSTPLEIDMRPGDVVAFRGAEIYHERYRPAGTAVLYLKFNDQGLDPLAEDPRTIDREAVTAQLLETDSPFTASISPRVVGLRTEEFFGSHGLHVQVRFVDTGTGVALSEDAVGFIRRIQQSGPIASALLGPSEQDLARDLARQQVLVLE